MAKNASTDAPSLTSTASAAPVAPVAPAAPLPASYEEALAELEQLVGRMEAGALPLEQLLVAYQRGAQLLGFCRERLQAVEEQVKRLEDGQIKPWDPA